MGRVPPAALHEPGGAETPSSPNFYPLEVRARRSLAHRSWSQWLSDKQAGRLVDHQQLGVFVNGLEQFFHHAKIRRASRLSRGGLHV